MYWYQIQYVGISRYCYFKLPSIDCLHSAIRTVKVVLQAAVGSLGRLCPSIDKCRWLVRRLQLFAVRHLCPKEHRHATYQIICRQKTKGSWLSPILVSSMGSNLWKLTTSEMTDRWPLNRWWLFISLRLFRHRLLRPFLRIAFVAVTASRHLHCHSCKINPQQLSVSDILSKLALHTFTVLTI